MKQEAIFQTASKTTDRPNYYLGGDVKKYCDEGIEVLKTGKELDPIWKETEKTKDSDRKELEKKKSNRKANKKDSLVEFRKTTDEIGIPWEWNSKLFVVVRSFLRWRGFICNFSFPL